jgi:hypothetical protein
MVVRLLNDVKSKTFIDVESETRGRKEKLVLVRLFDVIVTEDIKCNKYENYMFRPAIDVCCNETMTVSDSEPKLLRTGT